MPTIPSLSSAFTGLRKALTPPAMGASAYGGLTPPANPASPFNLGGSKPAIPNISTVGSGTNGAPMSKVPAAPASPFASNPAVPASPIASNPPKAPANPLTLNQPAPNMSTPTGPKYAPPPALPQMSPALAAAPAPAPAAPTAPAVPSTGFMTTPSGATVDPKTGSVISPAPAAQPNAAATGGEAPQIGSNTGNQSSAFNYSSSAGGPAVPAAGSSTADDLFKMYLDSLKPSKEEEDYQKRLDAINLSAEKGLVDTQGQPIALPFITGQQAAIERSQALQTKPLEATLARLQAKRTAALTGTKAAFERLDNLATKTIDIPFGGTAAQYDPASGTFKPIGGGAFGGANQEAQDSWVNLIKGGQAKLDDVPQQLRQGVAEQLAGSPTVSKANQDAIAQANTVIQKVDEIIPSINATNAGVAAYLANIKGTPQYNLAAQLDTIKSNVGFAALQAMRAASPTGGALGQVSEQENRLLQSTLASLDQGQSPEQLKANLAKVKLHFENLKKVLNAPINSQVSYNEDGTVVVNPPAGSGNDNSSQSGSLYDW